MAGAVWCGALPVDHRRFLWLQHEVAFFGCFETSSKISDPKGPKMASMRRGVAETKDEEEALLEQEELVSGAGGCTKRCGACCCCTVLLLTIAVIFYLKWQLGSWA